MISFRCQHCGKRLKTKSKAAGKTLVCPKCQGSVVVPSSSESFPAERGPSSPAGAPGKPLPAAKSAPEAPSKGLLDLEDPFQLDSPAISDLETRRNESEEIRAQKEQARQIERNKRKAREESKPGKNAGPNKVRPVKNEDRYAQPIRGQATVNEEGLIPFDSDDSPEEKPQQDHSKPKTTPSIFDEDLPDLSALEQPKEEKGSARPDGSSATGKKPSKKKKRPVVTEADLRELESLVPDLEPTSGLSALVEDEVLNESEYRVVCSVCGTAQYISPSAQGMKIKCPDCFIEYKAPPPPKNWKPKKQTKKLPASADIALAADERSDELEEERARQEKTRQILDKAANEITAEDEDRLYTSDFDTASFAQRTFGFLRDPLAIVQIIVYGMVFAGLFAMVSVSLQDTESYFGRGLLMMTFVLGPIIAFLFSLPMLSGGLALIEASANKQSYIREMPALNIFDNFADVLVIAVAFTASIIPGFIGGTFYAGDGAGAGLLKVAGMLASGLVFFPVFLLSMMDNGSMMAPISRSVLQSVVDAKESWGGYYLKTAIACFVTFLAWAFLLGSSPVLSGLGGFLLPLLVFFICQQLGALADAIGDSLSFSFEPADQDEEEDGKSRPHVIEDE